MKQLLLFAIVVAMVSCSSKKFDCSLIENGMTKEQVKASIGEPISDEVVHQQIEWLTYDDGVVYLDSGVVINCNSNKEIREGFIEFGEAMDEAIDDIDSAIFDF